MSDQAKLASPPLRRLFALGDLSQAGTEITVEARGEELAALACWAGVEHVRTFAALVTLRKLSPTRFSLAAELDADIVQNCVVTLEPLTAHIALRIMRELHLTSRPRAGGELTLAAGDDEAPEEIASLDYDLAAPLLEEFALAIDPYPRKQGAVFAPPAERHEQPSSPFAVLERLKKRR